MPSATSPFFPPSLSFHPQTSKVYYVPEQMWHSSDQNQGFWSQISIFVRVDFFHIVNGGQTNYPPPYPGIPVRDPLAAGPLLLTTGNRLPSIPLFFSRNIQISFPKVEKPKTKENERDDTPLSRLRPLLTCQPSMLPPRPCLLALRLRRPSPLSSLSSFAAFQVPIRLTSSRC